MSQETISLNDVGTDLQITIMEGAAVVDVSAATVLQIELTSPGGIVSLKTATLVTTGVDGKIHYVTLAGDIDRKGIWSYRGIVTFSAAQKFHSIEPKTFQVV